MKKTSTSLTRELQRKQPKRFSLPCGEAEEKNYKEEKKLRKPV